MAQIFGLLANYVWYDFMLHLLTKLAGVIIPNMLKQVPTATGERAVPWGILLSLLCAVCREQAVLVVIT